MCNEEIKFLSRTFLFKNVLASDTKEALKGIECRTEELSKGDIILSPSTDKGIIGFVMDGVLEVERVRLDENSIPLNTLKKYSSFGILSVFAPEEEYPTQVRAKTKSRVLVFAREDFISLIEKNSASALNVISFLCEKIAFLNGKIATFSEKNTLSKLCAYLIGEYKKCGSEIPLCATKMSAALGVGRASLYRDITALEEQDIITVENKKIIIKRPNGLERNKK